MFETAKISRAERERWHRVLVHITSGARLRRGLGLQPTETPQASLSELPQHAEVIVDPKRFKVIEAEGAAKDVQASEVIRDAAIRVDRARGRLRREDPDEALGLWHGLVRGRWSLVDWFDTDQRRYILAQPNPPDLGDPRGLSDSELQVVTYAAKGETGKLLAYRFGISRQRVSFLLNSAMHKLKVKTQAQLVEKMRGMPLWNEATSEDV